MVCILYFNVFKILFCKHAVGITSQSPLIIITNTANSNELFILLRGTRNLISDSNKSCHLLDEI